MGLLKKLLLIALILGIVWFFFFGKEFNPLPPGILPNDFDNLKKIEAKYSTGNSLFPSTEEKLLLLESELNQLKNSPENAFNSWIGIRLMELDLGKSFFLIRKSIQLLNPSNIDCSDKSGNISIALSEAQNAGLKTAKIEKSIGAFEKSFPINAKNLNAESHKTTLENLGNSSNQTILELQKYC